MRSDLSLLVSDSGSPGGRRKWSSSLVLPQVPLGYQPSALLVSYRRIKKCPAKELHPVYLVRSQACDLAHSRDVKWLSVKVTLPRLLGQNQADCLYPNRELAPLNGYAPSSSG